MTKGSQRAIALTWGSLAAFAVLQFVSWTVGTPPRYPWGVAQVIAGWIIMLVLAVVVTRRVSLLTEELTQTAHAHRATQNEVEQLQMLNAMLEILARTVDVPLAFQSLAQRIARLVSCDRVGLALLNDTGDEFQTYTARVSEVERRERPRAELVFKTEGTAIGAVVRTRQPLVVDDTSVGAPDFLDMNVTHSSGFASALVIPLVSNERAVGTLNVVSRQRAAFTQEHVNALLPIAEILAMAHVAQRLQVAATKHRTMESMTELTLSVSNEINSALQTIAGHCDLLGRTYPDPRLHRDVDTIVRQTQRISTLLDRMRAAAHERLNEAAETVRAGVKR
jgi:transcriptional regulator with GAF, ATPase, and Fis domain